MSYVTDTLSNLLHQTAFFNLTWGNYLMIAVACVFLFLAIKKGFEPLLLVPIAFGMLLVNIYPDIMAKPEDMSNGVGGLLHYFYILDEWSILPSLIFMGVGAMTDFGPLIANPVSFLMGAAGNLYGILPGNIYGLQRQGGSGDFYYRRCGRPDIYFPCRQVGADGIDGTDCSSGIFLYVTGSDYPASYHETFHDRGRAENQDGAASSGFETGEDFIPNHYYDCGVSDSSDYGSSRRYADAG
jgi:hypothetical protein